jgi:outer membrane lipoprotein-sorting protein
MSAMKRMILAALALFGTSSAMAQGAPPLPTITLTPQPMADASTIVAQVQAHLRGVRTLTADFTQVAGSGATARGRMTLARPGRVRFEYGAGTPFLIVSNGTMLHQVDYDLRQVQAWPVRDTPLALLLDPDAPIAKRVTLVAAEPGALANQVNVQARDPKRPEYGTLTLTFERQASAPGGLRLLGWRVLDAQGNTTTVRLANVAINGPVDRLAFTFRDPRRPTQGSPGRPR